VVAEEGVDTTPGAPGVALEAHQEIQGLAGPGTAVEDVADLDQVGGPGHPAELVVQDAGQLEDRHEVVIGAMDVSDRDHSGDSGDVASRIRGRCDGRGEKERDREGDECAQVEHSGYPRE
jgi:hypothetical protein